MDSSSKTSGEDALDRLVEDQLLQADKQRDLGSSRHGQGATQ